MSEKNCKDCKHWTRLDISYGLIEIDEIGVCTGLTNGAYYVTIEGLGEYIEEPEITTDYDFYCRNFKPKEEEKMQEHEKRMIEEYDAVQDRFLKLTGFLYTEKFNKLEGLDQSLLLIQHHHMENYRDALHDRMVRAGIDKEVL